MKKNILSALIITLAFSTLALAETPRLISVRGSAERSFSPDKAYVTLSLWGKGINAKAAQKHSQDQYAILKKSLDSQGVSGADAQTTGYELNPEYSFEQKTSTNKIVGYLASQMVKITLRKVELVGKFLDELNSDSKNLSAGTTVSGVQWDLEKRLEIEKSLLSEAVKKALEEAQVLALAANVKIKGLYQLAPEGRTGPIPMFQADSMMLKSARGGNQETAVFAGEVKVSASVNAQYEIE